LAVEKYNMQCLCPCIWYGRRSRRQRQWTTYSWARGLCGSPLSRFSTKSPSTWTIPTDLPHRHRSELYIRPGSHAFASVRCLQDNNSELWTNVDKLLGRSWLGLEKKWFSGCPDLFVVFDRPRFSAVKR